MSQVPDNFVTYNPYGGSQYPANLPKIPKPTNQPVTFTPAAPEGWPKACVKRFLN